MSITIFGDPIQAVVSVCEKLYPEVNIEIAFEDREFEGEEGLGYTLFPDDGSEPYIIISADVPYKGVIEIIAHEVAHVVIGELPDGEDYHGAEWQTEFDRIHRAYTTLVTEMQAIEDNEEGKI